ncbi:metal ABC transporter permease [Jeotgalibacillus sp. S-D1]|uniref:metal ABC transporter permease n=1 Tax=Jeotgalibacillus sp. S-D1 TaxID=2552189 RepID=UPI001059FCB7|nr:metal ABC transporter permease [Jeotgalibacillus sp. S-D1]TDL34789.1 metal ABC transporter permease [Jeotgalibacillus sp. S-D1]
MSYAGWILLTGALVGISCGLTGVLLILRKMAMMADAISHTVLLGIVAAYLVSSSLDGGSMLIGAMLAGLLTAWLVQWFESSGINTDAAIGVVFTTLFSIGVILISTSVGNVHLDVNHALMGEISFIPWNVIELPLIGPVPSATLLLLIVTIIVALVILLFFKEWKITTFDPALAASLGFPVLLMHYVFMTLVSVTTVAAFDAVGAIMVVAMLITPAASANLWTDRLSHMFLLSALFGVASSSMGYVVAIWLNTSISGSMAFSTGLIFLISYFFAPKHGQIAKRVYKTNEI